MIIYNRLIFLIGIFTIFLNTKWKASTSLFSVVAEFQNLTKILYNIDPDHIELNIIDINYGIFWECFLNISCIISLLILIDQVPSSWNRLTLGNRVTTSNYNNQFSLIFNETLSYLVSIPNLVTLTIGLLQAYSTTSIVYISYPIYLNLSSLIGLYFLTPNRITVYLKIVLAVMLVVASSLSYLDRDNKLVFIKGNYVNLGVSIICWLFAIYQEWKLHKISSNMDERLNGNMIRVFKNGVYNLTRSEYLNIGDILVLRDEETTPATILVERLRCLRGLQLDTPPELTNEANKDYIIGTYYDRESSGEDVSRLFIKGDLLDANRRLTRPDLEITGRVIKFIDTSEYLTGGKNDSVPHFLDNVRIISDLVGFSLLILISFSVSASAISKWSSDIDLISLRDIFTHLLAAAISANVLIPSMRMTLLYNVYNLVLSVIYKNIRIASYKAIPKLSGINRIVFDKTGTLTEERLEVGRYHRYPTDQIDVISGQLQWLPLEVEFALAISNNESNINPRTDQVWGTSPEECEIVNYWKTYHGLSSLKNPLRGQGVLSFSLNDGQSRYINIIKRNPYQFGKGKITKVELLGETHLELYIRQDGTSHISDVIEPTEKTWSTKIERDDPRRSMSIAYNLTDVTTWNLLAIYSFENPLRQGIPNLIKFVANIGLPPYILTGDGCEAAEEVARRAGFPPRFIRLNNSIKKSEIGGLLAVNNHTVSIDGNYLQHWLESEDVDQATAFLDRDNLAKVIYRASKNVKEVVAKHIGHAIYVGDAANDALAIQHSQVGISLLHGAEICRLKADLVMSSPVDLIGLLSPNGYRDMLLAGGERLLEDVCWMGGLTAGCLVVGLHRHGFQFLANSPLYLETWKPLPMLFVSSLQYTISVLAYASADCENPSHCWRCLAFSSARWHIIGLLYGMLLAWSIKNWYPNGNWSYLVLHGLVISILIRHSWHCVFVTRPRLALRRSGGLFGNQHFAGEKVERQIGFALSILDSVPARCLLYAVFNLLNEGVF